MARGAKKGWQPDPAAPGQERYWDGKAWTDERREAQPTRQKKKRGGGFLKTVLAVLLAGCLLIGGCVVLVGTSADKALKDLDAEQQSHAITKKRFDSIPLGLSEAEVIHRANKQPEDKQEFENESFLKDEPDTSSCIYYNKKRGNFGDVFQFCFTNGKLDSKNAY